RRELSGERVTAVVVLDEVVQDRLRSHRRVEFDVERAGQHHLAQSAFGQGGDGRGDGVHVVDEIRYRPHRDGGVDGSSGKCGGLRVYGAAESGPRGDHESARGGRGAVEREHTDGEWGAVGGNVVQRVPHPFGEDTFVGVAHRGQRPCAQERAFRGGEEEITPAVVGQQP